MDLIKARGLEQFCRMLINTNEFVDLSRLRPAETPRNPWRAVIFSRSSAVWRLLPCCPAMGCWWGKAESHGRETPAFCPEGKGGDPDFLPWGHESRGYLGLQTGAGTLARKALFDAELGGKPSPVLQGIMRRVSGPFRQHGQCGRWISDLFPGLARHVDDLALIHSMQSKSALHWTGHVHDEQRVYQARDFR